MCESLPLSLRDAHLRMSGISGWLPAKLPPPRRHDVESLSSLCRIVVKVGFGACQPTEVRIRAYGINELLGSPAGVERPDSA